MLAAHRTLAGEYHAQIEATLDQRSSLRQADLLAEMHHLDMARQEMEVRFARLDPDYAPFAELVPLPMWGEIATRCQAVLVDYRVTNERTYIFMIGPGETAVEPSQCIFLPTLTGLAMVRHVVDWLRYRMDDKALWREAMEAKLEAIYPAILSALDTSFLKRYPGIEAVVIFSDMMLHYLPLHAAWYTDATGGRRYFGDDHQVSYAPDTRVLARCLARQQSSPGPAKTLLAIESPRLPFAAWEILETQRHFQTDRSRRVGPSDIHKQVVIEAMPAAEHILFATHGMFNSDDAGQSAIEIETTERGWLTGREIAAMDLRRTRLAVLSACETTQRAALELFHRAHLSLYALSDSETPFASPYFWSAFFCFGAPSISEHATLLRNEDYRRSNPA